MENAAFFFYYILHNVPIILGVYIHNCACFMTFILCSVLPNPFEWTSIHHLLIYSHFSIILPSQTFPHTHSLQRAVWCSNCSVQVPNWGSNQPIPHCCEIIYHSKLTVKLHFISPRSQTFLFFFTLSLSSPFSLPTLCAAPCPRN